MKRIFLMLFIIVSVLSAQRIKVPQHTQAHIDSAITRFGASISAANAWTGSNIDTNKTSSKIKTLNGKRGVATIVTDDMTSGSTKLFVTSSEKTSYNTPTPAGSALTANKTLTFTNAMTVAAMQDSINKIPKNLGGNTLTVQFSDGTYTFASAGLSFKWFYSGIIYVQGNSGESGLHSNQAVIINRTMAANNEHVIEFNSCFTISYVINLRINTTDGSYTGGVNVYGTYCSFISIYQNCFTRSVTTAANCVNLYASYGYLGNNYVDKSLQAVRVDGGTKLITNLNSTLTNNPGYSYVAGAGSIIQNMHATYPTSTNGWSADYGGSTALPSVIPTTAPSYTASFTKTNKYGGASNFMGTPAIWFLFYNPQTGTAYKIPAYN